MRTRYLSPALAALLPLAMAGVGCDLVRAKAGFKDGNRLYKEENYCKAIDEYQRAVELKPDFAEAHFYLARSQQSLYRPGKEGQENKLRLDQAIEQIQANCQALCCRFGGNADRQNYRSEPQHDQSLSQSHPYQTGSVL